MNKLPICCLGILMTSGGVLSAVEAVTKAFPSFFYYESGRIPADDYALGAEETVVIGRAEKNDPRPRIELQQGGTVSGGTIIVNQADFAGKKLRFENVTVLADWGSIVELNDSIFINCNFKKKNGSVYPKYSAHFRFSNCVFAGSFFEHWSTQNTGLQIRKCSFIGVAFPTFNFKEDAALEAQEEERTIERCKFVGCTTPRSFIMATSECLFDDCVFAPDIEYPMGSKVRVRLNVTNTPENEYPESGDDVVFTIIAGDAERGSSLSFAAREFLVEAGKKRRPEAGELRTWVDRQGREMRAAVVSLDGELGLFRKKGGKEYRLAIRDLSDADRDYLERWKERFAIDRDAEGTANRSLSTGNGSK